MDETAIFKISYGLFYIGTEYRGVKNICVINTAIQVTQEPLRVSVTMLKGGYTHDLIVESGKFSIGIMGQNVSLEDVAHFGQNSGRNMDKLAGYSCETDSLGNPLYTRGCVASLSCRVTGAVDVGTHTIFIADLTDAKNLSSDSPLTYADYRALKAGGKRNSPQEPAKDKAVYQCSVCHYIYDGDIPFEELPDDWVCPVCKKPKSVFVKI